MRTIRLYRYELERLPEYSCTMPSGVVDWKMWRCNENFGTTKPESWIVAQYVPTKDRKACVVRVFNVEFMEGPGPLQWGEWTKIGARLWASFEYDIRRGHDVQKFHSVQLFVGDDPEGTGVGDEFVRVTRMAPWGMFRGLCDVVQAATEVRQ